MKSKWLRLSLIAGAALLVAVLAAGAAVTAKDNPSYKAGFVGSDACMGCHLSTHERWSKSGHAHMVVDVLQNKDLPADPATTTPELQAEIAKAQFIVAGQRFISRDTKTGDLVYLNVQFDTAAQKYVAYKGGSSWQANCAGCHTTGLVDPKIMSAEMGIGCESCHGPGLNHIKGKGDPTQISVSFKADTCGQCHNGGKGPDGQRWPQGYQIGQNVEDTGFKVTPVDPNGPPPDPALHLRQFAPFEASAHAGNKAITDLVTNDHANANCYTCHSAEARSAASHNEPITDMAKLKSLEDGISCVACHGPHSASIKDPKTLCASCHNGSINKVTGAKPGSAVHHPNTEMLEGYGAPGVEATKGAHTLDAVTCASCHMTEGNHRFKVILPEQVAGTKRVDTCTTCHTRSSSEIRGIYLELWQKTTEEKIGRLNDLLGMAAATVKAKPSLDPAVLNLYNTAKTDVSFVDSDGSRGAHNFEYSMKVLANAEKLLKEFAEKTK